MEVRATAGVATGSSVDVGMSMIRSLSIDLLTSSSLFCMCDRRSRLSRGLFLVNLSAVRGESVYVPLKGPLDAAESTSSVHVFALLEGSHPVSP